MYTKIVVGFRDDGQGREALALARGLAVPGVSEVIVASVLEPHGSSWDISYDERAQDEAERRVAAAIDGWPADLRPSALVIPAPAPAGALLKLATDESADLLVLGSTHRGPIGRVLLGTTSEQLLRSAPCAVAIAPHGHVHSPDRLATIGVAYDGSAEARAALAWAGDAARALGAQVRAIMVAAPPPEHSPELDIAWPSADRSLLIEAVRDGMRGQVDDALEDLPAEVPRGSEVLVGDPVHELRAAAHDGLDAMVLGSRGYGPLRTVLVGSVSGALVRSCQIPVIVVPRPPQQSEQPGESVGTTSA